MLDEDEFGMINMGIASSKTSTINASVVVEEKIVVDTPTEATSIKPTKKTAVEEERIKSSEGSTATTITKTEETSVINSVMDQDSTMPQEIEGIHIGEYISSSSTRTNTKETKSRLEKKKE